MKRYILLLYSCSTLLISCSQPKPATSWRALIDPADTARIFFDVEAFNQIASGPEYDSARRILRDTDGSNHAYIYLYEDTVTVSRCIYRIYSEEVSMRGDSIHRKETLIYDGYQEKREYKNSRISDIYWFYKSGNLRKKGKMYNSFPIGKYYEYDESGNIIFVEDTDAPFAFPLKDVLSFIRSRNINTRSRFFSLNRWVDDEPKMKKDSAVWVISYEVLKKEEIHPYSYNVRELTLSGTDGRILKDTIVAIDE